MKACDKDWSRAWSGGGDELKSNSDTLTICPPVGAREIL